MELSEEKKKELRQLILDKRKEGKVVVMGLEGPMSMLLEDIIKQPTDGLLYDLNRLEETSLTFFDKDIKWVNDFAVALVIRKLKSNITQLETELEQLKEDCEPFHAQITQRKTYKRIPHSLHIAQYRKHGR